ncbi:hypothetical protein ACF0H5_006055 [Mactra antiquata]
MRTFIVLLLVGLATANRYLRAVPRVQIRQTGAGCVYKGNTYPQGTAWQDGCLYNCICENAATGHYKCTDRCPSYGQLPPVCTLVKDPGSCCSSPKCNFQATGGSSTGTGTGTQTGTGGTGHMVVAPGTTCVNKLTNCDSYSHDICSNHDYAKWVQENCCAFCYATMYTTGTGGTMTGTGTGGTMTGTGTGGTMTGTGTGGTMTGTGTGGTMTGTGTGGTMTGTGTTTQRLCQDYIANCKDYTTAVCTDANYAQWVSENCPVFCGKCTAGTMYYITGTGTMTGTGGTMTGTGTGGTMTGTGTGTGGTMTGTGTGGTMTGTGTGGTMTGTGTGGTMTGTGTGGTMTGTGTMTGGTCADAIANCDAYGPNVCTDNHFAQWVMQNCQHYCNKCYNGIPIATGGTGTGTGTGGTIITGGGSCVDKLANCADYTTAVCTKAEYNHWVLENCPHFCNKCGTGGTMTGTGTGGTMTGTGTGTGGTMTGTGTGTGGTMTGTGTGTGGTMTGTGTGGTMTGTGTGTGTGGTMTGTGTGGTMTGTGTGGTMTGTGTGGTMTGTGTGGTMTGTGTGGIMTGGCSDAISNCASLNTHSHICTDAGAQMFAQQNCAATCNMCGTYTHTTGGVVTGQYTGSACADTNPQCSTYDLTSVCTDKNYESWAVQNCAHSCNLCSHFTSTSGVMTGTGVVTGSGSANGCLYDGKVYQQGAQWNDACKFSCTCADGSTGRYECKQLCVTWSLPQQCHMNPPGPGKCCDTPSCPAGFDIQYPAGYVVN